PANSQLRTTPKVLVNIVVGFFIRLYNSRHPYLDFFCACKQGRKPFHRSTTDLMQKSAEARSLSSSDTEDFRPTADELELQSLLDQAQLALVVRDPEDRICFWNKGAECLYGWRADEVTDKNVYELLFPRELQGIEEKERVLAETGEWAG